MNDVYVSAGAESVSHQRSRGSRVKVVIWSALVLALAVGIYIFVRLSTLPAVQAGAPPLPSVEVSTPLQRNLDTRLQFLGQFSPVDHVELRAQVGGTLTKIGFKDGDIVRKGDLLFEIDPVPYEIKLSQAKAQLSQATSQLSQANAQLESAKARLELATREFDRANTLKRTEAGSAQNVDQRTSEKLAAQAGVEGAKATVEGAKAAVESAMAMIRDAKFDLDHCRITAPVSGRMGTHLVSVGNLVAGSRGGSSTTHLATLVSLDPIYLGFDMSEADYMAFVRQRGKRKGPLADKVQLSLSDETRFDRSGTLDFVDNTLNRSSGTIRARATVSNSDLLLTPGGFASIRLAISSKTVLLVPDASVLPDQSDHFVLTIGPNDVVTPKTVQIGDLRGGLRVILAGLEATDRVIIRGVETTVPGSKVSPEAGSIQFEADQD
jgi:RND family efflux transporter MFP subunit